MIPYYSPHLRIRDIILALFQFRAEVKVANFFKAYTGKKNILFTSSCRSAISLTYQSLNNKGKVITSPLTCQSAIDPIFWNDNIPVFVDIDLDTLNIDPHKVEKRISSDVVAIQVINHGGVRVDSALINKIAQKKKIKIIEDCAQSFGILSEVDTNPINSDVSCYSLIKTGYGLGGGILATNDDELYSKAKAIQDTFPKFSSKIVLYRIIRFFLESKRRLIIFENLYQILLSFRKDIADNTELSIEGSKKTYLKKPPLFFKQYFAVRINKMMTLQRLRTEKGVVFSNKLRNKEILVNYQNMNLDIASFTKFFIYHPKINSETVINNLNKQGIEVKHLEQRTDSRIQTRFDNSAICKKSIGIENCHNYLKVHDHLVSLPLTEDLSEQSMNLITEHLSLYIK